MRIRSVLVALGMLAPHAVCFASPAVRGNAPALDVATVRQAVRMLMPLVTIPSASADTAAVRAAAVWLREQFDDLGFATRLLEDSLAVHAANPIVFAERKVPGVHPRVLFYLHYDTQPTGGKEDWAATDGAPFSPRLLSGEFDAAGVRTLAVEQLDESTLGAARLYARGAADDKAPIVMHLVALRRWLRTPAAARLNLAFLLDGEEEAGSPHIDAALAHYDALLKADLLVLCAGPMDALGRPSVYLGTRGDLHLRLVVHTAARSGHSGNYGLLPDAAFRLAAILASMKDARGRITVDGIMQDVTPPTPAERVTLREASAAEDALARHFGVAHFEGDPNVPYYERLLFAPSLIVNQTLSGRTGNQVPNRAEATVEVRLVTAQDPDRVFDTLRRHVARYVESQGWQPAPELAFLDGVAAGRMAATEPAVAHGIRAVERATGSSLLVYPTLGGTLPLLHSFARAGFRYIGLPLVNYDNNQHVGNENIRAQVLADGIRLLERLYGELAAQ